MISESSEGEMRLMDNTEAAARLREQLGLVPPNRNQQPAAAKQSAPAPGRQTTRRPGQRRAGRDVIGTQEVLHAARA
jgi:hypothetical protein